MELNKAENKAFKTALELAIWMDECVKDGLTGMLMGPGVLDAKIAMATEFTSQAQGMELDREGDAIYDVLFTVANANTTPPNTPLRSMNYENVTEFLTHKRYKFENAVASFKNVFHEDFNNYYATTDGDMGIDSVAREHLKSVKHLPYSTVEGEERSFGVLSSLTNTQNYDKPVRAMPDRSRGDQELNRMDMRRLSLLDEAGDPGVTLSVEKAKELGIPTGVEGIITDMVSGEGNLGDQLPIFINVTSPGESPMYVAHQLAEFLAYRGFEKVNLKTTHSIDEVETMFRVAGSPVKHPQRGDASWTGAKRPIIIDVDEGAKNENRRFHPVGIRDLNPEWLPALPTHDFDDPDFGKENRYGPQAVTIHMQPDEPFFVLLGRDPAAPDLVDQWAVDRNQMEMGNPKVAQAMEIANLMRQFKQANPDLGMSQNLYDETLSKELMYLVPRNRPYSEQEILEMAMTLTNAAVMSDVELNIQGNTCFTHIGKQQPVEQQLGNVSKIAATAGADVIMIMAEQNVYTKAWGNEQEIRGMIEAAVSREVADAITVYKPGEFEELNPADMIEVPGLNVMDRNLDEFPDREVD